jgi:hypothetical protein
MTTELPPARPVEYSFGDVFIEGWRQFRKNFPALLIVALCVYLPVNIALAFVPATAFNPDALTRSLSAWFFLLPALIGLLFGSLASLASALIVEQSLRGDNLTAWRGLARAFARWPAVLGSGALVGLILLGLGVLLLAPALFWGISTVFWLYAVGLRKLGVRGALVYSRALVRGRWWKVFGAWLVLNLLALTALTLLERMFGLISPGPFLAILPNTLAGILLALRDAVLVLLFLNLEAVVQPALPGAPVPAAETPVVPADGPSAPAEPAVSPWAAPNRTPAGPAPAPAEPSVSPWAGPRAAPAEPPANPWAPPAPAAPTAPDRAVATTPFLSAPPLPPAPPPSAPSAPAWAAPRLPLWATPRLGRNYQAAAGLVLAVFTLAALALLALLPGNPVDWIAPVVILTLAALVVSLLGLRASLAPSGEGRRPALIGAGLSLVGLVALGVLVSTSSFSQAFQETLAYSNLFPPNTPQVIRIGNVQVNVPAGWRRVNPATLDNCQNGPAECLLVLRHVADPTSLIVQRIPLARAVTVEQIDQVSWREIEANGANLNLSSMENLRLAGQPAIRRTFSNQESGAQAYYIYVTLVRGLTAYQLQAYSPNPQAFQAHRAELLATGESLLFVP